MKKLFLYTCILAACACSAFGQQPSPTPIREEASLVKISTNLIQVDVTVTDKNGKVVTGLGANAFEIFENGEKQKISGFSFQSKFAGGAVVGDTVKQDQTGAQPGSAPPLTQNAVRRTVAVVIDDLNLSFGSVYYTRKALRKFVDEQMQPNDLVAIIRTGGGIGALQQFTSDKRILYAAIERLRWNPLGSGGLDTLTSTAENEVEISEKLRSEGDAMAAASAGSTDIPRKSILVRDNVSDKKRTDYDVTRNAANASEGIQAQSSLATVRYIINGMNELPGRKVMMLFSDGIKINNESNKSRSAAVREYLRDLVDLQTAARWLYTFDTKGMRTMDIQASDDTYEVSDGHRQTKVRERLGDFRESQEGLAFLAQQTGGKSLLNSDDLNYGIQRALDEQAGYYIVAYQPDAETFDAATRRFNKLEVKVNRPGMNVNYRSGFFSSEKTAAPSPQLTAERRVANALMSPFGVNDIALNINALYADDPADGSYIRSFLHIDAKSLTFSDDADGWKKATFDVAAVTFGDNGVPVENIDSKYTIKTRGATYQTMLDKGFVYVLIMPIKKPGTYQYRVAVRDIATDKIGTASQVVEVPNLEKQKLAVSSIAVEDVSVDTWQKISQGKVGTGPGQTQVPSTLLHDTVLRQCRSGTVLRYGFEIYRGKQAADRAARLGTHVRILQNNKVVIDEDPSKSGAAAPTANGMRISGGIILKDNLPPGDYVLQVLVNDTTNKQASTQILPFEVVK